MLRVHIYSDDKKVISLMRKIIPTHMSYKSRSYKNKLHNCHPVVMEWYKIPLSHVSLIVTGDRDNM